MKDLIFNKIISKRVVVDSETVKEAIENGITDKDEFIEYLDDTYGITEFELDFLDDEEFDLTDKEWNKYLKDLKENDCN